MTSAPARWAFALAPDARLERVEAGVLVHTATGGYRLEVTVAETAVLERLAGLGGSEAVLRAACRGAAPAADAEATCSALLFRLERGGLLARGVECGGRLLASATPLRAPPGPPQEQLPDGVLRLAPFAGVRAGDGHVSLEAPGWWARARLHERALFPLLHDLAAGRTAAELTGAAPRIDASAVELVLVLLRWCGLVGGAAELASRGWSGPDLLFHASTRRGFARAPLGRRAPTAAAEPPAAPRAITHGDRIHLPRPDLQRLLVTDRPHGWVTEQRHSVREQGAEPLTIDELAEFLFRTLREADGHRPYPSAGGLHPLQPYLAVWRCAGLDAGFYRYEPAAHELLRIRAADARLKRLVGDAAGAAQMQGLPQVVLILAARYAPVHAAYGDLAYALVLKEVGAVYQAAMLAATATDLAACPLGCGDALLFAELASLDPRDEASVGEMILGSRAH
jgi:oxazoline/thiazoline dehydrogenase